MKELIEGEDYVFYCVIPPIIRDAVKARCRHKPKKRIRREETCAPQMYISNVELADALADYSNHGFDDLPDWIRYELRTRQLTFDTRRPESYERSVTNADLLEHKITNNELTINDYNFLAKKGMKYHV